VTEAQFTKQVIETANRLGWMAAHFKAAQIRPGVWVTPVQGDGKGFPDLVLVRERVIFVELKTEVGKLKPEQKTWLEALWEADQEAYVWTPKKTDEIDRILKRVDPPKERSAATFVRLHR
jgi:hypothetical protein